LGVASLCGRLNKRLYRKNLFHLNPDRTASGCL
jgi:hypothetical protein